MRFDGPDTYEVEEGLPTLEHPADLVIEALSPVVTAKRLARLSGVVEGRTHDVAIALEELIDPHNVSAVLRSCDAFGIQNIHVIVGTRGFRASRGVARGTHRWLDYHFHETATECIDALQGDGYKVYLAAMDGDVTLDELGKGKVAVVFGNEHHGVSDEMRAKADGVFAIPMVGFVESLNVSVAAAITIQAATGKRPASLSDEERKTLLARYLKNSVRDPEGVIREHLLKQEKAGASSGEEVEA